MKTKIKTKAQLTNRLDKAQLPYMVFALKGDSEVYTYVYTKTKQGNPCMYKFDEQMKLIDTTASVNRIKATYKAFRKEVK